MEANNTFNYKYALDEASAVIITNAEGIILHANTNFCTAYGFTPEQVVDQDVKLINSGYHTPEFFEDLWQTISKGTTWKGEIKNKASNGTLLWMKTIIVPFMNDGVPYQYFSISSDITERKNAEEHVSAMQAYLRSSIESFKDVLIFSIDSGFRYLLFNSSFKAATKAAYGTDITEGMSMLDSITGIDDRDKAKQNCERALAGESHTTLEVYGDLNKVFYETKYNPIFGHSGNITGVTVLSANITDRKLAEEQIMVLNNELEAFSYSVAHDLRAPLRSVNGYAQILKEDYSTLLDKEGQHIIEVIKSGATRMGTLIDDLLAFSRLGRQEIRKSDINMNALINDVVNEINQQTPNNAKIIIGNLHHLAGDYNLLRQVMFNLISNAVKYSSKKEEPVIEITSEQINGEVTISVKDNGAGFDMKYYNKLFGIFQRLHSRTEFEGTGVGLAIIQRIIHKHGGKVWGEGKLNEGADFFFKLPQAG